MGENSETKSKHFDKDYLYHNHFSDPSSQHSQIPYQNTIPPTEHFDVEDASIGWLDWSDNYNRNNPVNTMSESSSESLVNPGSFNLKEQNNQVWNTAGLTQNILKDLGFS